MKNIQSNHKNSTRVKTGHHKICQIQLNSTILQNIFSWLINQYFTNRPIRIHISKYNILHNTLFR